MNVMKSGEDLQRRIGVRALALSILNLTVGSGIFVLPALVAEGIGAVSILAYAVCGTLIFLIALSFAQLGSQTTASGGAYTYIETAFGPFAGFLANNIFWLGSSVVSDAAIANALADTLAYFIPSLAIYSYRVIFMFIVFGFLAYLNIRSVKNGVRFIEIAAVSKLIPLILLVILAARFVDPANLRWTVAPTVSNIGTASLMLFYAFLGLESPLSNGGEIKNPRRTVPLGILFGLGSVLILYVSIQLLTQGVLGAAGITAHKTAPLAAVAEVAFGRPGSVVLILVMAVAMLGSLSGEILAVPRILFAGARDGLLPRPLASVHPQFKTPHVAIGVYALLGFLLAISGGFKQLAILASGATLLIYLGVVLAGIKLRNQAATDTTNTFRIPGGIVLPLIGATGIIWLLSHLTSPELAGMAIFIAVFAVIYFVMKLLKKKP